MVLKALTTFAPGALWAIFYGDSRVLRVDAATGAVRRGSRLESQPVALAADDRAVWVATRGDNRVWRLDARTGEPIAGVPVGEPPTALTLAAGAVWIGGAGGTLSRVDPSSTALVSTLRLGRPIASLAPDRTGVWISVR